MEGRAAGALVTCFTCRRWPPQCIFCEPGMARPPFLPTRSQPFGYLSESFLLNDWLLFQNILLMPPESTHISEVHQGLCTLSAAPFLLALGLFSAAVCLTSLGCISLGSFLQPPQQLLGITSNYFLSLNLTPAPNPVLTVPVSPSEPSTSLERIIMSAFRDERVPGLCAGGFTQIPDTFALLPTEETVLKVCGSQRPEKPSTQVSGDPGGLSRTPVSQWEVPTAWGGGPLDEVLGDAGWTQRRYQVIVPKAFLEEEGVSRKLPGCQFSCLDGGHESGQGSQGTGRTGAWTLGPVGGLHPSCSAFPLAGASPTNRVRETINLPGRTRCPSVRTSSWLSSSRGPGPQGITDILMSWEQTDKGWGRDRGRGKVCSPEPWPHPLSSLIPFRAPGIQQSLCGLNGSLQDGVTLD